jgi:RES domain-containing protein
VAGAPPTPAFAGATLDLAHIAPGAVFGRIYRQAFPDPLGFSKTRSRFSDPRRRIEANRFGVLYLGSSLKVCFLEALLRDERDGVIGDYLMAETELDARRYAEVEVREALKLIDLRGDGPVRMGIPSNVTRGSKQALARKWSVAFHDHPEQVDGIIYASRLNGETNLAVYGRAVGKLVAPRVHTLRRTPGLAEVLNVLAVAIV